MNRDVRRVGHEPSLGIEHRAREVEAVANVGAHRRALEHHTHLLRDRLELVVEDLEENLTRENFSEDDVRDWISDAINNAEINVDISA